MAAVPRHQAAAQLRISVTTLKRLTAGGLGVVQRGGRGRGRAALFDVAAIRATLGAPSPGVADQLILGALAATLPAALADEFRWIGRTGSELTRLGVPAHCQRDLLRYIERRILNRAGSHFTRK